MEKYCLSSQHQNKTKPEYGIFSKVWFFKVLLFHEDTFRYTDASKVDWYDKWCHNDIIYRKWQ